MARQIASLVAATCAAYLPGDNHLYKHLIGTAISEVIITSVDKLKQTRLGQWVGQRQVRPQRRYELAIHDQSSGAQHRLYSHLEQLIVSKMSQRTAQATQAILSMDASGQMNMRRDLKSQLQLIQSGKQHLLSQIEVRLRYKSDSLFVSAVPPNLCVSRWASPDTSDQGNDASSKQRREGQDSDSNPPIWLSSDTIDLVHMEEFLTNVIKKPRRYELLVTDEADIQHIYDELQEWILAHCHESLYKGRAESKRGRLTVLPMVMNQAVESTFETHQVYVSLGAPKQETHSTASAHHDAAVDASDEDATHFNKRPPIWVVSRTAPIEILQRFLFTIVNVEKPRVAKQLRVHRWIVSKSRKRDRETSSGRWVTEYTLTNKTIANTIVSERVETELYADVRKFLGAEAYYAKKGLPWKRGYFLHGPPGTGKTSLIKAIANEFNLDIFSVDMACIQNDSELIALTTEISQLKKGTNYIVAFEDVDRSKFFKRGRSSTLSKQTMLNVLDGISESYGRLLFFTGNHPDNVMRMPAMVRPGRIDRCIPVEFVTAKQLARLLVHFYDDLEEEPFLTAHLPELEQNIGRFNRPLSPAAVMEAMLKHDTSWQDACQELFGSTFGQQQNGNDDDEANEHEETYDQYAANQHNGTYRGVRLVRRRSRRFEKTLTLLRMENREKHMAKQLALVEKPQFRERLDQLRTQIEAQCAREKERYERVKQRDKEKRERERKKQQKKKKKESNAKKVVRMAKQIETLKTRLVSKRKRTALTPAPSTNSVSARALRAAKRAKHRETGIN